MPYNLPTDPSKAADLARSPNASHEQLEALALSELPFLREAVASHPRACPRILARVVPAGLEDEVQLRIARALASNQVTPESILDRLLGYLDSACLDGSRRDNGGYEQLVLNILKHPNCPLEAASQAIDRSARGLRIKMAEEVVRTDLLHRLAGDRSEAVASVARARLKSLGA
jgi:hypothetical protein